MLIKYKWIHVEKGFTMPVCITTGKQNGEYRLEATTEEQEIVLKDASTIRFFNSWMEPDKVLKNSLTYYWTQCENEK
jgi:hypothetical protein